MGIIIMDQTTLQNDISNDDQRRSNFSSQKSLQSVPSLTSSNDSNIRHQNYRLLNSFTAHHSASVSSIAVAGSGETLFTGSSDREIASWSTVAGGISNMANFAAGNGAVKSMVASGERLFTAHQDHKIRVWNIHNGGGRGGGGGCARVATLPTLGDRAAKMITPGSRVTVRRHKRSTWVHHVDAVSALALSPDGSLLYSVSWDRSLKAWRTSDFRCLESVRDAHDDAINAVAISPDGPVYTGSADKKIKIWLGTNVPNHSNLCLVASLEKHRSGINALALSDDGSLLYSGASDRSVVVWEKAKDSHGMVVLGALRGHSQAILCLSVVQGLVISGSADKTVRVWRGVERSYSCLAVLQGHGGPVKCLTAVKNNNNNNDDDDDESYLIYSGGLDCEVKVWQIIVPNLL